MSRGLNEKTRMNRQSRSTSKTDLQQFFTAHGLTITKEQWRKLHSFWLRDKWRNNGNEIANYAYSLSLQDAVPLDQPTIGTPTGEAGPDGYGPPWRINTDSNVT